VCPVPTLSLMTNSCSVYDVDKVRVCLPGIAALPDSSSPQAAPSAAATPSVPAFL